MANPNAYTGTVVSGSGSTYSVNIPGLGTVTVTQLQIDPDETIPAGTAVLVIKNGSSYRMQVPVWLDDP